MIYLDGVSLSENLIWSNEFGDAKISQQEIFTIQGKRHINTAPILGGRSIKLTSVRSGNKIYGHYTRSQIQAISTLEENGSVVVFQYEDQFFNVMVKAGSINMAPLLAKANQGVDDFYTGSITLLEI